MTSQRSGVYFSRTRLLIATAICLALVIIVAAIVGVTVSRCPSSTPPAPDASTTPPVTTPDPNKPWLFIRLPRNIVPSHYTISLTPNFYTDEAQDFKGEVQIEFNVLSSSPFVLLHIRDIDINSFELYNNNTGQKIATGDPFIYEKNDFWVLPAKIGSYPKGNYRIEIKYTGSLKGIQGFYKSSYHDPYTKNKRHIVSTKFEPVDARRAFPSFDEPQLKAEYTVHLTHRTDYFALSNMNNVSVKEVAGSNPQLVTTSFARSVKMSTYLVAFVICDFGYTEGKSNGNKMFRVFAPKHKVNQTRYALDIGIKVQNYFEEYFDLPYALPKQDMIAIPNFASGAMENWGLITYRETALLYEPGLHNINDKFYVARVVAHELAHMWFGNVVTMEWWDDLWLNEGFASFASFLGAKHAEPQWDMYTLARLFATRRAFTVDDVVTSHPIIMEVNTPAELSQAFDTITYQKGQSVILMLESLMGEDTFKKGIQRYIRTFEYKNARTNQLWNVLSKETNVPVAPIMDTWTLQMGFPVVSISASSSKVLTGNQTLFLLDPSSRKEAPHSDFNYLWWARIDCLFNDNTTKSIWMNKTEKFSSSVPFDPSDSQTWAICNKDGAGFYRVNYSPTLWKRLGDVIAGYKTNKMTIPIQRAMLIDDVFALAHSGQVAYDTAMSLIQSIKEEEEYAVWMRANTALSSLLIQTSSLPLYGKLRIFIQSLTENAFEKVILKEATTLHETYLRQYIIGLACRVGSSACLTDMGKKFADWFSGAKIPLDIRSIIIKYGFKGNASDEKLWNDLWKKYLETDDDALKSDIMEGLVTTQNQWLIYRLLDFSMNGSLIKEQDFTNVIRRMVSQPIARPIVWTWFRENWEKLVERFTLQSSYLGRITASFAPFFHSNVQLEEMKAFFAKYPNAGASARSRQLSLRQIEDSIKWITANEKVLGAWLDKNVST